jgi:hypothetical protein
MSVNPWLTHVKTVKTKNPNLSYKEVLVKAKSSYTKKQRGGNPALIATAVADVANVAGDITKVGIAASQNDKKYNGRYDEMILKKRMRLFKKFKRMMASGKMIQMSDERLFNYIDTNLNSEL